MHFTQLDVPAPHWDEVREQYDRLVADLESAAGADQAVAVIERWDQLARRLETWSNLTHLRFEQDTRNPAYREARQHRDRMWPRLTELSVDFKRRLLASPFRSQLQQRFGANAFQLWTAQVTTYDPVIEQDVVRESELEAEYTGLLASAELEFDGQRYNLPGMLKFREDPRRDVRHGAERERWGWYGGQRETLDRIYGEMVDLRHAMAGKLGFGDFVELGYQRMLRIDYGREEVEQFRQAVRSQVTPLAAELNRARAAELQLPQLRWWDEGLFATGGNPAPQGDHDWLIEQARRMFAELGGGLDEFFGLLVDAGLLDLKTREGKAGGGFCTSLDLFGVPFIFANFNGTKGDVEVFTHEMGHAFQNYLSQSQPLLDYIWPTYDSCEIHSMSLEFLTWPWMELFFGQAAEQFRRIHLTQALLFLPYGVAVDHFQHLVYQRPQASAAERHAMWQSVERMYLPWRDYGDLEHPAGGGFWQSQRHIYASPFYYIDYTLALTCALQLWVRSRQDRPRAMADYLALCRAGGRLPFQQLVRSAGLISPFEPGCLTEVVDQARDYLRSG
ncbi:MAG: M3 family oligoendopeptidase [Pirellulaceae bacterium]|nr:M3 family oligoendopeptidase [Pirellulaceae bacterium]